MKKLVNVDLNKINEIIVNDELLEVTLENDGTTLVIDSFFKPTIVDSNFNEVADRINELEKNVNELKNVIKQ